MFRNLKWEKRVKKLEKEKKRTRGRLPKKGGKEEGTRGIDERVKKKSRNKRREKGKKRTRKKNPQERKRKKEKAEPEE